MHYLGSHVSILGDENLVDAAMKVKEAGGNVLQIFLTVPGDSVTRKINVVELERLRLYLEENEMKVVVHSSYLHNLCKRWDEYSWWLRNIELEMEYCGVIGAMGLVLHLGKKLDLSLEEAYNNMYSSLLYLHGRTKKYRNVKFLLETPTGQGTQVCYKIEDFSNFYRKISNNPRRGIRERFGICLDTCHVFTAGYDVRTVGKVKRYLKMFDGLIGLSCVKLIHLNDSKMKLGSLKDRHQVIGEGYIGLDALRYFYKYFSGLGVPVVLETPGDNFGREFRLLA